MPSSPDSTPVCSPDSLGLIGASPDSALALRVGQWHSAHWCDQPGHRKMDEGYLHDLV